MSYDTITNTFNGVAAKQMQCWCGVTFAIPASLWSHYQTENEKRAESYSLYCPLGHGMVPSQTEATKLRDELAREKHRREQAEARVQSLRTEVADRDGVIQLQDRRINGYKGVVARGKRRAMAGRCPCCSHQFKDLERHMKVQHPRRDPDRAAEALAK